jgi:hypothetical protein
MGHENDRNIKDREKTTSELKKINNNNDMP